MGLTLSFLALTGGATAALSARGTAASARGAPRPRRAPRAAGALQPAPVVVLVGSSAPSPGARSGDPPLAFRCLGARTLAEHVWAALAAAGFAAPEDVFVASSALHYK